MDTNTSVNSIALSIIVPVLNEEQNIPLLHQEITNALTPLRLSYEVIYIDDGSRDQSVSRLSEIAARDTHVTVICFRRNFGQTAALAAGIAHSQGDVIVLMDADLQNDPKDIPAMLDKLSEGYDVVSGWRRKRRDPFFSRKLPSRIANGVISWATHVRLHDYGCTLKAYRREVLETSRLYGEMHRFIPVYASWNGAHITEMVVHHRPRKYGKSKYGIGRTLRVMFDLMTVKFLGGYWTKPLYAFGTVAVWLLIAAFLSEALAVAARFTSLKISLHNDPLTLLGAILLALAVQLLMVGLLAELLTRTYYESQGKPTYVVRNVLMGTPQGLVVLPYRTPPSIPLRRTNPPQHILTLPSDLPPEGIRWQDERMEQHMTHMAPPGRFAPPQPQYGGYSPTIPQPQPEVMYPQQPPYPPSQAPNTPHTQAQHQQQVAAPEQATVIPPQPSFSGEGTPVAGAHVVEAAAPAGGADAFAPPLLDEDGLEATAQRRALPRSPGSSAAMQSGMAPEGSENTPADAR